MDFLKSTIASIAAKANSAFPYTLGEKIEFQNDTIWNLYHATRRSDSQACCVFEFDINTQRSRLPLARNAMKKLRTMRFPGIIKVLDTYESEQSILIATESVVPLDVVLQNRELMNGETIKWGLYQVANTVKFINVDASSIHGNIRQSSIFISDSGEWKLSGFELLTSTKEDEPVIYTFGGLVPDSRRFAAPEVNKGGWEILKKQPHHLVDSYLFGVLIFEIFNGRFSTADQLHSSTRKQIPAELFGAFKKLVQANPRQRASVKQLIDVGKEDSKVTPGGGFFRTDMIHLSENVDNLNVQNESERDAFVRDFNRVKSKFPPNYLRLKVLPQIVSCIEFGSGGPKLFLLMLDIAQNMEQEEFQTTVTPTIVKLYSSPDRTVRIALLENLPKYIEKVPNKIINDKIFPEVLTGFSDLAPAIREQTVKSVLIFVPKLSDRNINNDLLRSLARTQNDEQPGIRTNTTVCLGKIAHNLGPHTRSRVLTTAFTRSLKDPFVHARNAALMALAVTVDIFTPEDCCFKLLPAICPSLLDKEKIVRTQAHKTLEIYLGKVNSHAAAMPDAGSTQPLSSAPNSGAATPKPSDQTEGAETTSESSWGGWGAINGLAKRLVNDETGEPDHGVPLPRASSESSGSGHVKNGSGLLSPGSSVTRPSSSASSLGFGSSSAKFEPEEADDDDDFGWGDLDGDHSTTNGKAADKAADDEDDDWASFDTVKPARTITASKPAPAKAAPARTVAASTASTRVPASSKPSTLSSSARSATSTVKKTATGAKSHSIAAHKEQKKGSKFMDTGLDDPDDGWGDGW
ncbi:armadillo-type protein [Myxozyma melibiosi]|uniref:Armadillo-type protein n=1 Tax=Myxozyma melibiosi TaxID=54550 RepID=A0ABR1FD88_9ASCO